VDQEQFETLYRQWEKALYNAVYRWVWQEDEAMDIVQEAFVRLWASRRRVTGDNAKPYLFRIGMNLAASRLRRRRLWRWTGLDAAAPAIAEPAETDLAARERQTLVRQAVLALPEKHRRALVLQRFGDMSQRDIARALDIPEGTVASRCHTALNLLKKQLSRLGAAP